MSIVLAVILMVVTILFLLLVLALILPKQYSVAVSETINRPRKVVFDYVSLFKNQPDYSEWIKADPDLRPSVTGTDGTIGAVMSWESQQQDKKKNTGSGEQEIKRMNDSRIDVELRLIKPMPATCQLVHEFETKGENATRYTCTFSAYAKFPVNLPSYLIGRKFIAKTQLKTLRNIKAILEQSNS